jgi:hypothetical protein
MVNQHKIKIFGCIRLISEGGIRKQKKILQILEPRSDKHGIRVDPRNIATGIQREEPSLMFKVDEIFKTKSVLINNHT